MRPRFLGVLLADESFVFTQRTVHRRPPDTTLHVLSDAGRKVGAVGAQFSIVRNDGEALVAYFVDGQSLARLPALDEAYESYRQDPKLVRGSRACRLLKITREIMQVLDYLPLE